MVFYNLLIGLLRFVNHLYFVEIRSYGRENMPDEGPVLLAANHPSSILDTVLISTQVSRPIHYLARSGLFRIPILATFFRQMGAIPIYRAHETSGATDRNVQVFRKVYELFERGGCVGIFPEGKNSPHLQVGDIRKGAARMALGAEERNDFKLGLKVIPVGINFESRELLTSAVLLRFGKPIAVGEYRDIHQKHPEKAVKDLTDDIQGALRHQAMHIEDRRVGEMADDLARIFGEELIEEVDGAAQVEGDDLQPDSFFKRWWFKVRDWYRQGTPAEGKAIANRMLSRQYINAVLSKAVKAIPDAVKTLRAEIARYKDHLNQTALRNVLSQSFDEPVRDRFLHLRMTLYAILMAPVALFGFIHNVVPYLFAKLTARLFEDEAVRGFAYFVLGLVAFGGGYALFGFWLWQYTDLSLAWTLVYVAALPPTGFVALRYRRNILIYRDKILVRTLFWDEEERVKLLRKERQELRDRFLHLAEKVDYSPKGSA